MPRSNNAKRRAHAKVAAEARWAKKDSEMEVENASSSFVKADGVGASHIKIQAMCEGRNTVEGEKQSWILAHVLQLTRLLCDLLCPNCMQTELVVSACEGEQGGFALKLQLSCDCGYEKCVMSSPRQDNSENKTVPFEVNTRMTLFSHEVGGSYAVLKKFSSVMGMPAMHEKTFHTHDKRVTAVEIDAGEAHLQRSAEIIRHAYADTDEDLHAALDKEKPVIDISVSYDGTWMKRGFTSKYGVGITIDVLTGLVVDFFVLSKYCHACALTETKNLPPAELEDWKRGHQEDCCVNHWQSSKAMEQRAAEIIWGRSLQKYNFRYVEMLSDGDSSAYKAVCQLNPYGDTPVEKLECLNHAHKRLGTALRKLAKDLRLGARGLGRLTDRKCDMLQNYYRGAILNNLQDVVNMRNAVWVTLWHSMSTNEQPRHMQCPKGENSWCFYQAAIADGQDPATIDHESHPGSTFLSTEVAQKIIPVYKRMTEKTLLRRLVHGGTQNTNECLNAMIWNRCLKTTFMGRKRVEGSVARAVCVFNEGATEMISVMNRLHMDISTSAIQVLCKKDNRRMRNADSASTEEARRRRKEYAQQRRLNAHKEHAREGNVYEAGGH